MVDRPYSLHVSVRKEIEKLISDGAFGPGDKLPSEHDLAKRFRVSRMTLREALRALEDDGLLAKKHGVGTFVKAVAPRIKSILDINYGVTEMIRNMGYVPGTKETKISKSVADAALAERLDIPEGSPIIAVERTRTANGTPVVFSLDVLPTWVVGDAGVVDSLHQQSLYELLEEKCNITLSSSVARLFPIKATRAIASKLNTKENSPLFLIEQVDSDQMGKKILYSREYFLSEYFDFVIYRRRRGR